MIPDRWRDWFVVSAVEGCQRRFVRRPDMRGDNYGQGKEAYEDRSPLYYEVENKGRWPTNVVFTHNERCERTGTKRVKASGTSKKFHEGYWTEAAAEFFSGVSHPGNQHGDPDGMETVEDWACVNECPVRQLNEQVGLVQSGSRKPGVVRDVGYHGARKENVAPPVKGSVGHASRFYVCLPGDVLSDLHFREHGDPLLRFLYCSKASKKERTVHGAVENKHPTVKPIKLMEWLCRITKTPTGGTVFDPFCGTGTTAIAALLTGRRFVGIEQDSENFDIAWRRIDAWIRRHDPKQLTLLDVG